MQFHDYMKIIKDQIKKNYLCNIFNVNVNLDIRGIEDLNVNCITEEQAGILSKYSVDLLSSYLYKDNQYIYFDKETLIDLEEIYQGFYIFINAFNKNQNIPIYTRLFFKILNSLKEGGSFCYAPSIPFIEKYINKEKYIVSFLKVHDNLYMTKILRSELK